MKLAQKISDICRQHLLENNGILMGGCLSAVGWVGGTVPELTAEQGILELPTSDVMWGGLVTGFGLACRRPILVIRYQPFSAYNMITVMNYAAKSKAMWNTPCPVFIRSLAMEGSLGPVATGAYHSVITRAPGMIVYAPMTPNEWKEGWDWFMAHDDPFYCSEHRASFNIDYELPDQHNNNATVTIFAVSQGRINALKSLEKLKEQGIVCNLIGIKWLKPLEIPEKGINSLKESKFGIVVDSDFTCCGISEHIAYELMLQTGKQVYALGLEDRTSGFSKDNTTPTAEKIVEIVKKISGKLPI